MRSRVLKMNDKFPGNENNCKSLSDNVFVYGLSNYSRFSIWWQLRVNAKPLCLVCAAHFRNHKLPMWILIWNMWAQYTFKKKINALHLYHFLKHMQLHGLTMLLFRLLGKCDKIFSLAVIYGIITIYHLSKGIINKSQGSSQASYIADTHYPLKVHLFNWDRKKDQHK